MSAVSKSTLLTIMLATNFTTLVQAEPTRYGAYYVGPDDGYRDWRTYRYLPAPAYAYAPPLIVLVPVRPASCGRYRYWDGERCADARYDPPYVGPRW